MSPAEAAYKAHTTAELGPCHKPWCLISEAEKEAWEEAADEAVRAVREAGAEEYDQLVRELEEAEESYSDLAQMARALLSELALAKPFLSRDIGQAIKDLEEHFD